MANTSGSDQSAASLAPNVAYKKVVMRQKLSINKSLYDNGVIKADEAMLAVIPESPFLELNEIYTVENKTAQVWVDKKWAEYTK